MDIVIGRPTFTWDKLAVMNNAGCCAECGNYIKYYNRKKTGKYWYCKDCADNRIAELAYLNK